MSIANMFISRLVQAPCTEIKHRRLCLSRSPSHSRSSLEKSVACRGTDSKSVRREKAAGWEFKAGIRRRLQPYRICMTMRLTGGRCSSSRLQIYQVFYSQFLSRRHNLSASCYFCLPHSLLLTENTSNLVPQCI